METIKDYFLCEKCKNKDFIKIYNFSAEFRKVNFSDNLLYDLSTEEIFQCTHCKKTLSRNEIQAQLKNLIDARVKNPVYEQED